MAAALVATLKPVEAAAGGSPAKFDRHAVLAKLGDTLIPSLPGDPGYATLEPYNITAEVMRGLGSLPDEHLVVFSGGCAEHFGGKNFLELSDDERAAYLNMIADGDKFADKQALEKLQGVYRLVRARVFIVFYQNYPQHIVPRDSNGMTLLPSDDQHQITNPNQPGLVTGWDIAGWTGPMTWEEEEQRRAHFKKVRWKE